MKQHLSRPDNHILSAKSKSYSRAKAKSIPFMWVISSICMWMAIRHNLVPNTWLPVLVLISVKSGDVHPPDCYPVQPTNMGLKDLGPVRGLQSPCSSPANSDSEEKEPTHVPYMPITTAPLMAPHPAFTAAPPATLITPPDPPPPEAPPSPDMRHDNNPSDRPRRGNMCTSNMAT